MKISRRFTQPNQDVFSTVEWTTRTSRITNSDGSVVFEMTDAEVPASWSQLATDIMVSKYFRKAGVPLDGGPNGIPSPDYTKDETSRDREGAGQGMGEGAVQSNGADTDNQHTTHPPAPSLGGRGSTGPEKSAKQVIHRLAGCWRHWGEQHGYFDTPEDAQAFYDELCYMMLHQMAAPNSPQWFNTGLNWAYGINGPAQGHWICDPKTGEPRLAEDAYTHPQPHACFIQSVDDDLVNDGGIMDLWTREARLFKYGSGTGTNFSNIRGENEPLSGGGRSSGLMSFLKIGDRAAGAIKSGGTTRRAAKMVCLDADHPDIEDFVNWKVREELKVAALVEGIKHLDENQKELAESLGLKLNYDFNGEAYYTVSGQNSNNSVRLTDTFFKAVEDDGEWELISRITGEPCRTIKARDLWHQICRAAWRCADPGVQYDTTINQWHTCPNSGRINASNPCSEYMFLDNTACNLASINVLKFYNADSRTIDLPAFEHAIELWTTVLEISVLMASFPSRAIAEQSYRYRTLGLGYANLGAMLMQAGIPYDSDEGRAICGAISAILCGRAYATSSLMASEHGPFARFHDNRQAMLRVMRNHRRAAHGESRDSTSWEGLSIPPVPIDHDVFAGDRLNISNRNELLQRATQAWDDAVLFGETYGYRNAQVTVIAPTGTIGLLMDCDTTGVEPDFALVKFKKLAGGGYFKIANASLVPALKALGYNQAQIADIERYVMGQLSLDVPMPDDEGTFREYLINCGYTADDLVAVESTLRSVFELRFAFNAWSMPEQVMKRFGVDPERARVDATFNGLRMLGLSRPQIEQLNERICGTQTVEGAPQLRDEHLPVFDCASTCGTRGRRYIAADGHIRMMAAAQPFISGAISKTINLPNDASVDDFADAYWLSWDLGLKANALYRDGSKLSQPLSTKSDASDDDDEVDDDDINAARAEVADDVAAVAEVVGSTTGVAERSQRPVEKIVERIIERPMRKRLPDTRRSVTHRFNVTGHEGYLTVGLYEDGSPGELFITMSKEGSTIGGLMDSLGTAISVALQYGVPLESLVKKFAHQRFEPGGMTTNRDIPFAKSLVDYIFRWLGMEFIPGYREENAPRRGGPLAEKHAQAMSDQAAAPKVASAASAAATPASKTSTSSSTTRDADRNITEPVRIGEFNNQHDESPEDSSTTVREDTDSWSADSRTSHGTAGTNTPHHHGNGKGNGNGNGATANGPENHSPATTDNDRNNIGAPKNADAVSTRTVTLQAARFSTSIDRYSDGGVAMTSEEFAMQAKKVDSLSQATASLQADAPACEVCGSITVRNGTCYKCFNCGNSMGCS